MAEWSARRTRNPAVPGSSPALINRWICSRWSNFKFSAMLLIANWLPPASWGFQSCYVVFEIFVSEYLTSFCKLAVLSIIKKTFNLLNL